MNSEKDDFDDQQVKANPPETGSVTIQHSWDDSEQPAVGIVNAVAAATGQRTTELPPLQHHVDTDALDTLLTNGSSEIEITFTYASRLVSVSRDGTIELAGDGAATEAVED
jgi:hypothetical protein